MVSGFSAFCLDVQLSLFSVCANLLQHQIRCRQHDRVDLPGRLGADGHAPHAGDTQVLICILGILGIDGMYRALLGAKSAVVAPFARLGAPSPSHRPSYRAGSPEWRALYHLRQRASPGSWPQTPEAAFHLPRPAVRRHTGGRRSAPQWPPPRQSREIPPVRQHLPALQACPHRPGFHIRTPVPPARRFPSECPIALPPLRAPGRRRTGTAITARSSAVNAAAEKSASCFVKSTAVHSPLNSLSADQLPFGCRPWG